MMFKNNDDHDIIENKDSSLSDNLDSKPYWGKDVPGKLYEIWPKVEGKPEEAVFLAHCSSVDMQDEMLINMLGAYGIPALKQYPHAGGFGKVILGMSGDGADIFVPVSLYEDAKALMEDNLNE